MKRKLNFILWISWALFTLFLVAKSFEQESPKEQNPLNIPAHKLGEELRLMTWNLGSYCLSSRYFEGVYYKNKAKPQSQRQAIAKTIAEINPDVLCIQEIGDDYLDLFLHELESLNLNYPHHTLQKNLDENRCIAIISKIPFDKIKNYDNVKFSYQNGIFESVRGLLLVELQDIFIATLHAKSRRPFEQYPEDKNCEEYRQKELEGFGKILSKYKGEKVLLCGDFNEEPTHSNIKNFEVSANLYYLKPTQSETWTYSFKSGKITSCFDFFLASPSLSIKSAPIIHKDYKLASDHRCVYLDVELAKKN